MRSATAPLYEQTRQGILKLIQESFVPGELLPSQEALSKKFGASLITIKRAINELARDQVVEPVRGRGTVVRNSQITDRRHGVSSWTDSITGLGERPGTAWTRLKRLVPESRIRHLLQLKARQAVVEVERLRVVNDKPICLMQNYLPATLVPGLEDSGLPQESLYQCLRERYGLHFTSASEHVRARTATPKEKKLLGSDATVVLEIERVSSDAGGHPIEWARVIAHADRYTYQTQLTNP